MAFSWIDVCVCVCEREREREREGERKPMTFKDTGKASILF